MKLHLLAIGRLKAGPERELVGRYRSRIDGLARSGGFSALATSEFPESRARTAPERRAGEAASLLGAVPGSALVVFDETAASLPSTAFADRLRDWRDGGRGAASFMVGGPDGLDDAVRARADLAVSFGLLTLPHQLVRVLVVEQLYRALTILAGHPYHRDGGDRG